MLIVPCPIALTFEKRTEPHDDRIRSPLLSKQAPDPPDLSPAARCSFPRHDSSNRVTEERHCRPSSCTPLCIVLYTARRTRKATGPFDCYSCVTPGFSRPWRPSNTLPDTAVKMPALPLVRYRIAQGAPRGHVSVIKACGCYDPVTHIAIGGSIPSLVHAKQMTSMRRIQGLP